MKKINLMLCLQIKLTDRQTGMVISKSKHRKRCRKVKEIKPRCFCLIVHRYRHRKRMGKMGFTIEGVCFWQQIPSLHRHRHLGSCHTGYILLYIILYCISYYYILCYIVYYIIFWIQFNTFSSSIYYFSSTTNVELICDFGRLDF